MRLFTKALKVSRIGFPSPGISLAIVMLFAAFVSPFLIFRLDFKVGLLATLAAIILILTLTKKELAVFLPIVSLLIEFNYFPEAHTKLGLSTAVLIVCTPSLGVYVYQNFSTSFLQKVTVIFFALSIATLSNDPGMAEYISLSQWMGTILFGAALTHYIKIEAQLNRVILAFTTVSAVIALGGLLQTRGLARFWIEREYALGLPDSTLGYYSNFASFCAVMAVVTFGLIFRQGFSAGRRVFFLISSSILVTSVILSLSRGALVLLVAGLIGVVVLNARSFRDIALIFLASSAAFFAVYALLPSSQLSLLAQRFLESQGGDNLRFQLQGAGAKLLWENPVGIGLLNFSSQIQQNGLLADKSLTHAHSTFLQLGLNFGWLGLGFFIWLILLCIRRFWKSTNKRVSAPYFFALVAFLVQALQDYMLYETHNLLELALIIALCLRPVQNTSLDT